MGVPLPHAKEYNKKFFFGIFFAGLQEEIFLFGFYAEYFKARSRLQTPFFNLGGA